MDLRMETSWRNKGGMGTILKYIRDEGVRYMSNVAMAFLHSKRNGSQGEACTRWIVGYLDANRQEADAESTNRGQLASRYVGSDWLAEGELGFDG